MLPAVRLRNHSMIGMNRATMAVAGIAALLAAGICFGEELYQRERYDVIVERSPFGPDPLVLAEDAKQAQEEAAASAAAKALEKELRLCFLLETEQGDVRAGFQNLKVQKGEPRSVMLMVGESYNGMKLQAIDLLDSTATLLFQGKSIIFELTKAKAAPAKPAAPAPPTQQVAQRRFGGGFRSTQPPPAQPEPPPEPALSPEEQEKRREEVRENLRQYQMEVIRAGMPPLPIPLTKEMDDQLVAEGVLPPVEEGAPAQ